MTPSTFTYEDILQHTRGERGAIKRSDRCRSCARPRQEHAEDGKCPVSFDSSFQSMNLPNSLTCADCVHVRRCVMIFGQLPEDECCQFFPVRFYPANIQGAATPVRHETETVSIVTERLDSTAKQQS